MRPTLPRRCITPWLVSRCLTQGQKATHPPTPSFVKRNEMMSVTMRDTATLDAFSSLPKPLVLVVEDEAALATMLRYNLEKQGYRVEEAADGQEALTRIAETQPDLVLLDWMLPVMSGLEVCRQIRRRSATRDLPVIIVTARAEDQDAVRGLNTGADDYITKPFSMDALLARIRALLRRSNALPAKGLLTYHDITMDLAAHRVQRNGRPVHLGPTEFRLMEFFIQHPRRVFSREELLDAV